MEETLKKLRKLSTGCQIKVTKGPDFDDEYMFHFIHSNFDFKIIYERIDARFIKQFTDLYESIDHIALFLSENNSVKIVNTDDDDKPLINYVLGGICVSIGYNMALECGFGLYYIGCNFDYMSPYYSLSFVEAMKEYLDTESRNKLIPE